MTFDIQKTRKEIAGIKTAAGRLQDRIHKSGMSILTEWMRAGEAFAPTAAELLSELQSASPYHANAFSHWVAEFTPLVWNKDKEAWVHHAKDAKLVKSVVMAARDKPFWLVKPAAKADPYNMFAAWQKFYGTLIKHAEKPKEGEVVDMELVRKLREMNKAFESKEA